MAKSHDVAVIAPTRALVWRGLLLKQFGWRVVILGSLSGTDPVAARWGMRFADAFIECQVQSEGFANEFAAGVAEAASRPGAGLRGGPPVSVVSTVLNEERAIAELVRQVGEQLLPADEFIIVDGGSTDSTLARLRQLSAADPRIRWIGAPGTNIAAGRNAGIAESRNAVIATTDADCWLSPGWLEALRRPFADPNPVGLVAGNCAVRADGPFERAQALACYADPFESRFPSLLVRAYGRLFGSTFDPTLPFARSLAFTKEAWELAGGFPERLHWVEDGVFGRNVARHRRCAFAADALVSWRQRGSAKATLYMYLTYGRGAAKSGERQLVARDLARLLAYVGATGAAIRGRRGRIAVLIGGAAYLSVPLTRVIRYRAGVASGICVPVVLAAKDLGKVGGELSALLFPGEDLRSQWPPWRAGRAHS